MAIVAIIAVPLLVGRAGAARTPTSITPPTSVKISQATTTSLTLSWQPPTASVSSTVQYETFATGRRVASGLRGLTYTFVGLACGQPYTLAVDAYTQGQRSSAATAVGSTAACSSASAAPPPDTSPPSAPGSLHLSSVSSTAATLTWDASSDNVGIMGYGAYLAGKRVSGVASTSYVFANLPCGATVTLGVDAVDAAGNRSTQNQLSASTGACASPSPAPSTPPAPTSSDTSTPTTTPTSTSPTPTSTSGATLFVSPGGSDGNSCTQAAPCASLNGAYQRAAAGSVVQIANGTYPYQLVKARPDLRNLSPGCTPAATDQCVRFVGTGVTVDGQIEIHGSDIWLDGGSSSATPGFTVRGRIDTEADSNSIYPDHVVVQGTHSTSLSIFNTDTATFRWMDVGPATVSTGCAVREGAGGENMIGFADGVTVVPQSIVIDGLRLHDQNGDSGRIAADCHWGGLFLVTANGLTIKNSVFEKNVVYNVEIQNFVGPAPTNVTFTRNSFGCPVDWLYNGAPCDGQSSIQFDGTFPGITITNNSFADGVGWWGQGFGCYRDPCDFSGDTVAGNSFAVASIAPPALP